MKKISAFEYAINEAIDPKLNEGKRPETESERTERRRENIKRQLSRIKVK